MGEEEDNDSGHYSAFMITVKMQFFIGFNLHNSLIDLHDSQF
jgi:hypothetical protein